MSTGDATWKSAELFRGYEASVGDVELTVMRAGRALWTWSAHDTTERAGTVSYMAGHEVSPRLAKHAAELAIEKIGRFHG